MSMPSTATVTDTASSVVTKTADLANDVVARARQTSLAVRDQAGRVSERAVAYVHAEPVKAVLIATAAGALLAAVASWALRSRG